MGQQIRIEGSGGREHAIGIELAHSADVESIYVAPGNAGTVGEKFVDNMDDPDLIVIGPEALLIDGRVDQLEAQGYKGKVLGFDAASSFLEATKVGADEAMERWGVVRPPSIVVRNYDQAMAAIANREPRELVFKADEPAGGKGVVLPETFEAALKTIEGMLSGELFGGAGKCFQVQDRWHGAEVSVFGISDGQHDYIIPFFTQDHKRLLDGDRGDNTGGMGAYSPVPETIVSQRQREKIYEAFDRTYSGMRRDGFSTKGILYGSFMLAEEIDYDPAMIEYNIRFGDPEAQALLPVLTRAGVDVHDLLRSAAAGNLRPEDHTIPTAKMAGNAALTNCLAAPGYPEKPRTGQEIFGLDRTYESVILHYAGAKRDEAGIVRASGGRVIYVTGVGEDLAAAKAASDAAIGPDGVYFDEEQHRTDIGWQAIAS